MNYLKIIKSYIDNNEIISKNDLDFIFSNLNENEKKEIIKNNILVPKNHNITLFCFEKSNYLDDKKYFIDQEKMFLMDNIFKFLNNNFNYINIENKLPKINNNENVDLQTLNKNDEIKVENVNINKNVELQNLNKNDEIKVENVNNSKNIELQKLDKNDEIKVENVNINKNVELQNLNKNDELIDYFIYKDNIKTVNKIIYINEKNIILNKNEINRLFSELEQNDINFLYKLIIINPRNKNLVLYTLEKTNFLNLNNNNLSQYLEIIQSYLNDNFEYEKPIGDQIKKNFNLKNKTIDTMNNLKEKIYTLQNINKNDKDKIFKKFNQIENFFININSDEYETLFQNKVNNFINELEKIKKIENSVYNEMLNFNETLNVSINKSTILDVSQKCNQKNEEIKKILKNNSDLLESKQKYIEYINSLIKFKISSNDLHEIEETIFDNLNLFKNVIETEIEEYKEKQLSDIKILNKSTKNQF